MLSTRQQPCWRTIVLCIWCSLLARSHKVFDAAGKIPTLLNKSVNLHRWYSHHGNFFHHKLPLMELYVYIFAKWYNNKSGKKKENCNTNLHTINTENIHCTLYGNCLFAIIYVTWNTQQYKYTFIWMLQVEQEPLLMEKKNLTMFKRAEQQNVLLGNNTFFYVQHSFTLSWISVSFLLLC